MLVGIGDLAMARIGYPLVMVAVLCWLRFGPLHSWWLYVALGFVLAAIVLVLSALVMRKWRALVTLFVLLAVWIVGEFVVFAYRLNNVCRPGDRIIQSEAAAIKMAQTQIFRARYGMHGIPGYVDEKPHIVDFDQTLNCCKATRTRNIFGVIVWEIYLDGETVGEPRKRKVGVDMKLSNCGAVFHDSFIAADPIR